MKPLIKGLLRENLFNARKEPKIFLRKTISPKNDLIRNFSCYHDAWFENRDGAEEYYEEQGGFSQEPRQDPITKRWCGASESGLSGYIVENQQQFIDALNYLNKIPHLKKINEISVFKSSEYYLEDGSDGEDTFVGGKFLFNISSTITYKQFTSKLISKK